jgi:hypothetical protein
MSHNFASWPAFWRAVLDIIAADHFDERWSHLCSYTDVEILRLVFRADMEAECVDRHRAWLTLLHTRNELHQVIHGQSSPHRRDPELNYAGFEVAAPRAERPLTDLPQAIGTPSFLTPEGSVRLDSPTRIQPRPLLPSPATAPDPAPFLDLPPAPPPPSDSAQILSIHDLNQPSPASFDQSSSILDFLRSHTAVKKSTNSPERVYSQPL